jgi:tRNA wybutosine-synthesizing protein 1
MKKKFNELVKSNRQFDALDYSAETPLWAIFGAAEKGFNPNETRHYRSKLKKIDHGC